MLEECGLPYAVVPVNIGKDEQFAPASSEAFFDDLLDGSRPRRILAGFDFPIGLLLAYGSLTGLGRLCKGFTGGVSGPCGADATL